MITEKLTQEQRLAVDRIKGKVCLRAGAGTGKTSVLVHRYLNIMRKGLADNVSIDRVLSSILAVTFTRRAAKEMRERIEKELIIFFPGKEDLSALIQVSTIDSFCIRILREKSVLLGIDSDFNVLDEVEAKLLFFQKSRQVLNREALPEIEIDKSVDGFLSDVFKFIQKLKSMGTTPDLFYKTIHARPFSVPSSSIKLSVESVRLAKLIHRLYFVYEETLRQENLFDFHRLLLEVYNLWEKYASVKKEYQEKYQYILIDEYQDTSPLQDRMLKVLAELNNNYFVVGDAKQAIYGFRGGEPRNILDYEKETGENCFSLTRNFRSYEEILEVVNRTLKDRIKGYEEIHSYRSGRRKLCELLLAPDPAREARFIGQRILSLFEEGYSPGDIVVLLRGVRRKAVEYEEVLRGYGVSTVTIGGSGFYDRPEVKDIFSLLKLTENPFDEYALVRMLRSPLFRIRNSTLARLASLRPEENDKEKISVSRMPLYDALSRVSALDIENAQKEAVTKFLSLISHLLLQKNRLTLSALVEEAVHSSGYLLYLETLQPSLARRCTANVYKLLQLAREFEGKKIFSRLRDFMKYLEEVIREEVVEKEASLQEWGDVVRIMTIHQAKGLEFPVVFVSNLSHASFPSPNKQPQYHYHSEYGFIPREEEKGSHYRKLLKEELSERHTREEQRLLYVAMTRAREKLIITGSQKKDGKISRFMDYFLKEEEGRYVLREEFKDLVILHAPSQESEAPDDRTGHLPKGPPVPKGLDYERVKKRLSFKYPAVPEEPSLELTVSQLAIFRECPARYYYRYVLNLPQNPGTGEEALHDDGFERRLFGDIIHCTLEEYFRAKKKGVNWNRERLERKFKELCVNFGISQRAIRQDYLPCGRDVLKNIFHTEYDRPGREIVALEQPFVLYRDGDIIKGVIDRIDQTRSGVEVIDYKTSSILIPQRYAFQMQVYGLASAEILRLKPDRLTILGLAKEKKVFQINCDPEIEKELYHIRQKIKQREFRRNRQDTCPVCEYSVACLTLPEESELT